MRRYVEVDLVAELRVPEFTALNLLAMIDLANEADGSVFMIPDERAMKAALRRKLVVVGSNGGYGLAPLAYEWAKQYRRTLFRVIQGGKS